MNSRGPSRTARNVAMCRAVHQLLDDYPKILTDPFARDFAGFASDEALLTAFNAHPLSRTTWARTAFVLRNRYAEDELVTAVTAGTGQYVILGAGLDSFAYRRPDLMASLDVYEVDHSDSQEWKRERIAELGIPVPPRLHYAPIDFEHHNLAEGLAAAGLDRRKPVFLSWLGVTQYLSRESVQQTMAAIASLSTRGSTLVVGYVLPASALKSEDAAFVMALAANAVSLGEPWLSYFSVPEMAEACRSAGFACVSDFGPEEAHDRYLKGRTDGLYLPAYFRMAEATTG